MGVQAQTPGTNKNPAEAGSVFELLRYCGWYSNRSRGARVAKAAASTDAASTVTKAMSEVAQRAKAAWARLIRKVYEADPLEWPVMAGSGTSRYDTTSSRLALGGGRELLQAAINPERSEFFLDAILCQALGEGAEVDLVERLVLVEAGKDVGGLAGMRVGVKPGGSSQHRSTPSAIVRRAYLLAICTVS